MASRIVGGEVETVRADAGGEDYRGRLQRLDVKTKKLDKSRRWSTGDFYASLSTVLVTLVGRTTSLSLS